MNRSNCVLTAICADSNPETPFYGLLAFCRDLDAERRRIDQEALQAALETLNAPEVAE